MKLNNKPYNEDTSDQLTRPLMMSRCDIHFNPETATPTVKEDDCRTRTKSSDRNSNFFMRIAAETF